ncbi:hypothetical protein FIBSPDRAFT_855238 [Athelia psychrophila]|uniref:Uncharacterized protein n=1 Tax=Athelia psychrophila TaxID=1759441 RepID=A0A166PCJ5_9AGAM|nr:hypothetical protein FIBSPDRAFT_855238 [Fibularhizoctonia sp. CBS 109695]
MDGRTNKFKAVLSLGVPSSYDLLGISIYLEKQSMLSHLGTVAGGARIQHGWVSCVNDSYAHMLKSQIAGWTTTLEIGLQP